MHKQNLPLFARGFGCAVGHAFNTLPQPSFLAWTEPSRLSRDEWLGLSQVFPGPEYSLEYGHLILRFSFRLLVRFLLSPTGTATLGSSNIFLKRCCWLFQKISRTFLIRQALIRLNNDKLCERSFTREFPDRSDTVLSGLAENFLTSFQCCYAAGFHSYHSFLDMDFQGHHRAEENWILTEQAKSQKACYSHKDFCSFSYISTLWIVASLWLLSSEWEKWFWQFLLVFSLFFGGAVLWRSLLHSFRSPTSKGCLQSQFVHFE